MSRILKLAIIPLFILTVAAVSIAVKNKTTDRVAVARERIGKSLAATFKKAGVPYPADQIFLRAFKRESELEMWAGERGKPLKHIATYPILAHSGGPGPKRREGDRQVPEGFYTVDRFNPKSSFHLSLGLNYPNTADRILSDPARPGADIFIHGSDVSIGCLAMGDERIEEIYLAALDSRARPLSVHIFPARMNSDDWPQWHDTALAKQPVLAPLWSQLARGFDLFEKSHLIPVVKILKDGSYRCEP